MLVCPDFKLQMLNFMYYNIYLQYTAVLVGLNSVLDLKYNIV